MESRESQSVSRHGLRMTTSQLLAPLMIIVFALLAGCAEVPKDPEGRAAYEEANDPAEPTNRVIFAGNYWLDRNVVHPVAAAYRDYLPDRARLSVHDFTSNLKEPSILVNDVLQGNFGPAWVTTQRFVLNSTVGVAGFFDVATDWGCPYHDADFGQTFGVWGIGTGPAVQLPLLGPSNVRDSIGTAVGFVANPLSLIPGGTISTITLAGTGASVIDQRAAELKATDALEATSIDYYATLRSLMAQKRAAFVEEGKAGDPSVASP